MHLEKNVVFFFVLKGKDGLAVHIYKKFMRQTYSRYASPINTSYIQTQFLFTGRRNQIILYITRWVWIAELCHSIQEVFFCCNRILLELVDTLL